MEEAHTLRDMLYYLRDSLGKIKDEIIARVDNAEGDSRLCDLLGGGRGSFLTVTRQEILDTLDRIVDNEIFREEPEDRKPGYFECIMGIRSLAVNLDTGLAVRDIPELSRLGKVLYETIEPLARKNMDKDPLTGLLNYAAFCRRVDAATDNHFRQGENASIIMMDMDRFKELNDSTSHDYADIVLRVYAGLLKEKFRGSICRRSGDEFLMMLPGIRYESAGALVERRLFPEVEDIIQYVEKECAERGVPHDASFYDRGYKVTVSAGVTSIEMNRMHDPLERVARYARGKEYAGIRKVIREANSPNEIMKILGREDSDRVRSIFVNMLLNEAEKAMHDAKRRKNKGEYSAISLYK